MGQCDTKRYHLVMKLLLNIWFFFCCCCYCFLLLLSLLFLREHMPENNKAVLYHAFVGLRCRYLEHNGRAAGRVFEAWVDSTKQLRAVGEIQAVRGEVVQRSHCGAQHENNPFNRSFLPNRRNRYQLRHQSWLRVDDVADDLTESFWGAWTRNGSFITTGICLFFENGACTALLYLMMMMMIRLRLFPLWRARSTCIRAPSLGVHWELSYPWDVLFSTSPPHVALRS